MPKKTAEGRCDLCGTTWRWDDPRGLAHMLVAHGPLVGTVPGRRRKVRAAIPRLHRRLEELGLDEATAHQVLREVMEELRKAGAI